MALSKYGIKLKKYLKEYYPLKYSELTINCTLMDYLYEKEKELIDYANYIENQLRVIYPEPKTNEFLAVARYNYMIKNMMEEYINYKIKSI